jgi:low temperature requirement protein LtrA
VIAAVGPVCYKNQQREIHASGKAGEKKMSNEFRKATWLELFFDLIFVVAVAKAAHALGHVHHEHIEAASYLKYVLIMVPLWWAWTGHTLFANRYDMDDVVQRLLTLAQMACAISLSVFIDPNFDPNYVGFLLSYATFRGLLVLMYWRTVILLPEKREVALYLAKVFAVGVLISLASLGFDGVWKYIVLYLGIAFDIIMPVLGRQHLKALPVEPHHMPERFGLLTIILLGESIVLLVSTFEQTAWSGAVLAAGLSGFVLAAAVWWIYFENLEGYIYGRRLETGQATIYLHLFIYIGLGGIANVIRFAIAPELTLYDYKLLAGTSTVCFMLALQLLHFAYHPLEIRRALLTNAGTFYVLLAMLLLIAPTVLTVMLGLSALFVVYALGDAVKRTGHAPGPA